jgi:hypothetical protein
LSGYKAPTYDVSHCAGKLAGALCFTHVALVWIYSWQNFPWRPFVTKHSKKDFVSHDSDHHLFVVQVLFLPSFLSRRSQRKFKFFSTFCL